MRADAQKLKIFEAIAFAKEMQNTGNADYTLENNMTKIWKKLKQRTV